MYRADKQPSRLEASFNKLKALHQRGDDTTFTPLEVLALLHLIEPRSIGWDFVFGLASRADADYEDCQSALEKLRQLTMTISTGYSSMKTRTPSVNYESILSDEDY